MKLRVLVACEFSGIVRDAFARRGHDAWSCDLLPTESPGNHIQGDVLEHLSDGWDLMIAHPPCTYLTCTGNKWFKPEYKKRFPNRETDRSEAIDFFRNLANAPIEKIAIENPVGIMSTIWRKPNQIIQPYYFGHPQSKTTCLWLKNLPHLTPTEMVKEEPRVIFKSGKSMPAWYVEVASHSPKERTMIRNRTFTGIAEAMAEQWGLA